MKKLLLKTFFAVSKYERLNKQPLRLKFEKKYPQEVHGLHDCTYSRDRERLNEMTNYMLVVFIIKVFPVKMCNYFMTL